MRWLKALWICVLAALRLAGGEPGHASSATPPQTVVLRVVVNREVKGDFFLELSDDGDLVVSAADLRAWGLTRLDSASREISPGTPVSLRSLAPAVTYEIEERSATVEVTADPRLLGSRRIDLGPPPPRGELLRSNSAFLNTFLAVKLDDDLAYRDASGLWELGANLGRSHLRSTFSFVDDQLGRSVVRETSILIRDHPETLRRLSIGDYGAASGPLGGSGRFGGVQVESNFSLRPSLAPISQLQLDGVLSSPSEVELYVNGTLTHSRPLPAGEFQLVNLRVPNGANDVELLVRDADGRERRLLVPFYASSRILRQGLHDYSYALGFRREPERRESREGRGSFDYGELSLLGFHRYGFRPTLTAGWRVEADRHTLSLGPSVTFAAGRAGEVEVNVAHSRQRERSGFAGELSHRYLARRFSTRIAVRALGPGYSSLSRPAASEGSEISGSVGFGLSGRRLGGLSAIFRVTRTAQGLETHRTSLQYAKSLSRRLSLHVLAAQASERDGELEVSFGLNLNLDGGRSARVSYLGQPGTKGSARASLQRNAPLGRGFGYRLEAETGDRRGGRGRAALRYRGDSGEVALDYRKLSGEETTTLRFSSGVTLIGGSLHLSRPIQQGFALVRTEGLAGIDVLFRHRHAGRTNRRGELFLPELVPYLDNRIALDLSELPLDYELKEADKIVATPFRGGGVVRFGVRPLRAFTGRVFVVEAGERRVAEPTALLIRAGDQQLVSYVGRGGEIYLENLEPGTYPARLAIGQKTCRLELIIPDTEEPFVDLGSLDCTVGEAD